MLYITRKNKRNDRIQCFCNRTFFKRIMNLRCQLSYDIDNLKMVLKYGTLFESGQLTTFVGVAKIGI